MPDALVKYGFTSGVMSDRLVARADLGSYNYGLLKGRNFCIDYLGGAFTRAGTEFIDYIQHEDEAVRLVPFEFNAEVGNTYGLIFSKDRIRFIQDGAYTLDATTAIASTTATTVTTSAAHGFLDGDWIKLLGRTLEVTNKTATTFEVITPFGVVFDPSAGSPTECFRLQTISSPYATADLAALNLSQKHDEMFLTQLDYAPRKLTRSNDVWSSSGSIWALAEIDFIPANTPPVITGVTSSGGTGAVAGVVYAVTRVDNYGNEQALDASAIWIELGVGNITTAAGSFQVDWTYGSAFSHFRIYRSLISADQNTTSLTHQLGYIGTAKGFSFTDENITPDFTQGPPMPNSPFAHSAVVAITVTAGGSGYDPNTTTVTAAGFGATGSGFIGKPIIQNGVVIGIWVISPGQDYLSTVTITISGGGGTGATAVHSFASALSNLNPQCSSEIQQRRVYAGSGWYPNTIYGSRVGEPDSFYDSGLVTAADPYTFSLNSKQSSPIRFIVENPDGMILFGANQINQVRGSDDAIISIFSGKTTPQPSEGCAQIQPLTIGREYLHVNRMGTGVNTLRASNLPGYFTIHSLSNYSTNFFDRNNQIVSWDWALAPHKLLWAAREDGTFLSCTFDPEQQIPIVAWTEHTTKGWVEHAQTITEGALDRTYFVVKRIVNGVTLRVLEQLATREASTPDVVWSVDSGLSTNFTYPAASITPEAYTGANIEIVASAAVFVVGDVGSILRVGGGRATVVTYNSTTSIDVTFDRDIVRVFDEFLTPPSFAAETWSLDAKVSSVSGLWHLEGEEVQLLGDGVPLSAATVASGAVTLSTDSSHVVVGLNFTAHLKTPPPALQEAVLQHREKRPVAVAVRLHESKEILVGQDDVFYDLRTQGLTAYVTPATFLSGIIERSLTAQFDFDGAVEFKKTGPVQATILGYVVEFELADS